MNVLYITGACLTKNTSANMSHNAYIKGLLENNLEVDIIMANDSWGEKDSKLKKIEQATYYEYNSISTRDRILSFVKKKFIANSQSKEIKNSHKSSFNKQLQITTKETIIHCIKKVFNTIFKQDKLYPIHSTWLKNASKFKSTKYYDLVISNSSPSASHKLVPILKSKKQIKYKTWIQIWEDPWFYDLYGKKTKDIYNEEHLLLQNAEEIYYVSPLTLLYQKKYFSDCENKMDFIPLPYLQFSDNKTLTENSISFGYFGDYYSYTRNLRPFYEALLATGIQGNILGDTDLHLKSTDSIHVSGRVTLDTLEKIQDQTTVLVHLCNLRGGQIPGKIYHYSATLKPILFILDGTEDEQKIIRDYFSQYDRYYFCANNKEEIVKAINEITAHLNKYMGHIVLEFSPKYIVNRLLSK